MAALIIQQYLFFLFLYLHIFELILMCLLLINEGSLLVLINLLIFNWIKTQLLLSCSNFSTIKSSLNFEFLFIDSSEQFIYFIEF
jgi:hypothetical protein